MASVVPVSLRAMTQAVRGRLETIPHGPTLGTQITPYNGRVPGDVPLMGDGSDRVAPYVVLYPRPGHVDEAGADLADRHVDAVWAGTLTIAAGDIDDAVDALDRLHTWLHRWAPPATGDLDGLSISGLRHPAAYVQPPVLPDDDVRPPRFFTTAEYVATLSR